MRKQSIANRKYLERLEKDNPEKLKEMKYKKAYSSAKSFVKNHGRPPELKELKEMIEQKLQAK